MNRNYWVRPIRHSRSGFDYGRTRLANDNAPCVSGRRLLGEALLIGTAVMLGVLLFHAFDPQASPGMEAPVRNPAAGIEAAGGEGEG